MNHRAAWLRALTRDPFHVTAAALAFGYFAVLWVTAPDMGFTRDEGYYFKAAEEYAGWWGVLFSRRFLHAFSDAEILRHFSYNTEHPPLVKLAQGVTYHLFHRALGWASPAQGFRAAGMLWASASLVATYLLGRRLAGPAVGLFAAAALAVLPRYFYDAHLACFDVPITAMWTFALLAFHRAWTAPRGWLFRSSLTAGVVFGLALATKLNALFLPFVFVAMWAVAPPDPLLPRAIRGPSGGPDLVLPALPLPLVACAVVGPLVFVATWPYLWHDTVDRIAGYLRFHLRHEHYPISYFHELLVEPPFPWHFPFVMSAATIPTAVLLLGTVGVLGSATRAVRRRSLDDALIVVATLLPIGLIALPSTPIFGGVKHWYNAMPTLFIAAGGVLFGGARALASWARSPSAIGSSAPAAAPAATRGFGPTAAAASALVLAPGLAGTVASHPNGIGYYDAIVGGFRGGAELGMQRMFWSGLAFPAFSALSDLPPGARVFFNRTNWDSYLMYRREGHLPESIGYANEARDAMAGIAYEQPEHGETEADIWSKLGTRPVAGTYQDGVTLTQIYREGASRRPPTPE